MTRERNRNEQAQTTISRDRGGCNQSHPLLSPAHATSPARNGLIAFAATTRGREQIYTVRPNGHGLRQITHVAGAAIYPAWSPDGRRIVFELDHANGAGCSIKLVHADGSHLVGLTLDKLNICASGPSFTPNGSRIVFERLNTTTNDDAIWSMSLTGTDWRQ